MTSLAIKVYLLENALLQLEQNNHGNSCQLLCNNQAAIYYDSMILAKNFSYIIVFTAYIPYNPKQLSCNDKVPCTHTNTNTSINITLIDYIVWKATFFRLCMVPRIYHAMSTTHMHSNLMVTPRWRSHLKGNTTSAVAEEPFLLI